MAKLTSNSKSRFRFKLQHVLYAIAVFGVSLGLCGGVGLLVAPFILALWWTSFEDVRKLEEKCRQEAMSGNPAAEGAEQAGTLDSTANAARDGLTVVELLVVIAIIGILVALLLPAVRMAPRHWRVDSYFRSISLALENYHSDFESLPPAFLTDAEGRPMHSWRVLILPYLEQEELYNQYRFEEPWNGPNNIKLLSQMPPSYAADHVAANHTACQAVVGPETAWPGSQTRKLDEIIDADDTTVLLVECETHPVPWMSPQDLSEDEAARLLTQPPSYPAGHWKQGFFSSTCYGRLAVFKSSRPRFGSPDKPELVRQMVRVADGLPGSGDGLVEEGWYTERWQVVHYGNYVRLAIFLIVVLWPSRRLYKAHAEMRRKGRASKMESVA